MGKMETHISYYLLGFIKPCLVGVTKTFHPGTEDTLPHLMGAGVPLWEKLHRSLSSVAPVLNGPSIGRH